MAHKQKEPYKLKLPAVLAAQLGQTDSTNRNRSSIPAAAQIQQRKALRVPGGAAAPIQRRKLQRKAERLVHGKAERAPNSQRPPESKTESELIPENIKNIKRREARKRSKAAERARRESSKNTDGFLLQENWRKEDEKKEKRELKDVQAADDDAQGSGEPVSKRARKSTAVIEDHPKPILKRTKESDKDTPAQNGTRTPSPPRMSRTMKQKLEEDDAEVAALEKRLGIKGRKLPKSFKEDGLDELLGDLGDESDGEIVDKKRKRDEDEEWLAKKRQKAVRAAEVKESNEQSEDQGDDDMKDLSGSGAIVDNESVEDEDLEENQGFEDDEFSGFESEDTPPPEKRIRENPYVAPSTGESIAKYIPPSLRKASASDSEDLIRLRRQLQGLINRLTDANLISILEEVEKIYRTNARQHVTSTLLDLLLTSVCEPTSLPDTLIILPAGFIAAVYKIIGTDFGAQVVQRTVELFDQHYKSTAEASNDGPEAATFDGRKETANLITLLSELYNFQVVGSLLMFDFIRLFLSKLSELNTELLLRVIRISGPQLRQDDPSSIKDIITMLRPAIANIGEANLSVRTKFMIETINDLKNNKMKTGAAASAVVSEHTKRMKKTIGTLNTRSLKASEPLRIGLKDIQDSDKKGKWWLVGASWAGNEISKDTAETTMASEEVASKIKIKDIDNDPNTTDLQQMARDHRMNTDIRRSIFITIMSAQDYLDAYNRLLKLHLKKSQEREIPGVLLHCAAGEKTYNPYYTLIARKLCQGDRRLKMGFQFCCWDLLKRMGAGGEEDDDYDDYDDAAELELREVVNLAKMFGNLISSNSLSLTILKKLTLNHLSEKARTFAEVLFITLCLKVQEGKEKDEASVRALIQVVKEKEGADGEVRRLVVGMQWFLRKVVRKTDLAGGRKDREVVQWCCDVAGRVLLQEGSGGGGGAGKGSDEKRFCNIV